MASSVNPTTWTAFYDDNRNDGGAVEALFQQADDTLLAVAKSHTLEPNKLIATITGGDGANLLLVPSAKRITSSGFTKGQLSTSCSEEKCILPLCMEIEAAPLLSC
jgi:hypothetical protein